VKVGDTLDEAKATAAVKALYATGFFKDVKLKVESGVLIVQVEERPAIAQINITGAKAFEKDKLKEGLKQAGLSESRISDTAAYFTGRAFGKRKLAYHISPGKTWEGVAGAVLAVVIYGVVWVFVFADGAYMVTLIPLLIILTVLGIMGDLFESLIKRQAGVKDSGNILPGHGGILDRIDALTAALPVAILAVQVFNFFQP
jgi:predicted CDP-diglyceride synthetase/phosphatidate cytidylyltransferase